jgi:hypothetical protein
MIHKKNKNQGAFMTTLFAALFIALASFVPATLLSPSVAAASSSCDARFLGIPPWYRGLTNSDCSLKSPSDFSWSGKVIANLLLGKTTSAQLSGEYSAPRVIAQGKETSTYSIDLGLRQNLFDRKLSLNLMVRDLLNSRKRNTITWGDGFYQTNESFFRGRMIGLTATYNFGNMKPKQSEMKKADASQEMNMENGMD